jgi:S-adenosylmethionine synthetase
MKKDFMITSEYVTEGHPDKLCDQISDAIVDHFLTQDPYARVRAECAISSAIVFIAARFATSAKVDLPHVARKVIKRIGYDDQGFNSKTCSILTAPQGFPPDKKYQFNEHELSEKEINRIAAKNQVTVFGFACDQTPGMMPVPIWLARKLSLRLDTVQYEETLPYLVPDGKVQVGIEYQNRKALRIHSITITAMQRSIEEPSIKTLTGDILETVVRPVFEEEEMKPDRHTRIFVNPDGPFLGGPGYHSGLTGRKNAIDAYGEYSRHSGHALSGKDPMRIDRAGAYAARYAAKNVVSAGLARECEVALSYSIGVTRPVSLQVETFGTGKLPDPDLTDLVERHFDFRLAGILRQFNLRHLPGMSSQGFYQRLAGRGHFGRTDMDLPWERNDKADLLSSEVKNV